MEFNMALSINLIIKLYLQFNSFQFNVLPLTTFYIVCSSYSNTKNLTWNLNFRMYLRCFSMLCRPWADTAPDSRTTWRTCSPRCRLGRWSTSVKAGSISIWSRTSRLLLVAIIRSRLPWIIRGFKNQAFK